MASESTTTADLIRIWRGCQKRWEPYSDDPILRVPDAIQAALQQTTSIPSQLRPSLPPSHLPIYSLLHFSLPPSSDDYTDEALQFSNRATGGVEKAALLGTLAPPSGLIQAAASALPQRWLDGMEGVLWKGRGWPLWVVPYWALLSQVHDTRSAWQYANSWISRQAKQGDEYRKAASGVQAVLKTLGWGGSLKGFHPNTTSITVLAGFLSEHRLSDLQVSLHTQLTERRLRQSALMMRSTALGPQFFNQLHSAHASKATRPYTSIDPDRFPPRRVGTAIEDGTFTELGLTIFVGGNHWITAVIDFTNRSISIADSLHTPLAHYTEEVIKPLQWYILQHEPEPNIEPFSLHELPCGRQTDGFSCGFLALNALEHYFFPTTPLVPPHRVNCGRMDTFVRIARAHLDTIANVVSFPRSSCFYNHYSLLPLGIPRFACGRLLRCKYHHPIQQQQTVLGERRRVYHPGPWLHKARCYLPQFSHPLYSSLIKSPPEFSTRSASPSRHVVVIGILPGGRSESEFSSTPSIGQCMFRYL